MSKVSLPPLEEQRRIAAILDKADGVRRKRKEAIRLTEELLKSTFLEMFGDPVTNPKGWEVKTIEDITVNQKGAIKRGPFGGALKKDIFIQAGFLVYEQYHALNNDFSFERYYISEDKFEEMKGFEVKPGDIIISCSGVYLGKLAIVPENAKLGIINQALLRITLNQRKMNNYFFLYHFSHESFRDKFFAANRGSGVPNFPPISEFKTFPFIVPPIEDQNKFSARLQQIQGFQSKAYESIKESENLFNSLLQRAFRGEL
ncbi:MULTISPECIES: restriction endonuclease subunit S [unclassified Microcystis]|uniref:restriction endonuclease subunit S n=1 Tax=unclassified Microcystis TaxID=2643300 RepID=UPI001197782A|nr:MULTISPECIES: restriction endonuclease subunit S [unclassified Microcystis]MCA2652516.1 restriction endonuclease subunit S [Microcystis sp. M065S2]MCA2849322.1 restriction endonuclease subunit S [Microcystis sp. M076S1]MCA2867793.1 restriction endonuclease subunit S [Microcystis sp. M058S1]MCA2873211.1 restriction endonuclease subunit S [Microcystis sp. M055S1]MCA2918765.1 restriction endonuclease subunit S [Microcystis sp. M017S1]MCA2933657.1 restriction endonuclease subunit S [Microcysti